MHFRRFGNASLGLAEISVGAKVLVVWYYLPLSIIIFYLCCEYFFNGNITVVHIKKVSLRVTHGELLLEAVVPSLVLDVSGEVAG